jgi:hypothetical protein
MEVAGLGAVPAAAAAGGWAAAAWPGAGATPAAAARAALTPMPGAGAGAAAVAEAAPARALIAGVLTFAHCEVAAGSPVAYAPSWMTANSAVTVIGLAIE